MVDNKSTKRRIYPSRKKPLPPAGKKRCSSCKEEKACIEFYISIREKDMLMDSCKDCVKTRVGAYRNKPENKDAKRVYGFKWREKNKDTYTHRKAKTYGITGEQYNVMLESQGMVCAICKQVNAGSRSLNIDHDHKTGKVRGLLCTSCNTMLGKIGDNMETLYSTISYLASNDDFLETGRFW